ncbi:hypothetical protein MTBLM5_40186 [Magnetospirillum sp. LM-5]|nr:hypothetical protein MTBLM5_40186 [Magnetospirillum sp. LM-5]
MTTPSVRSQPSWTSWRRDRRVAWGGGRRLWISVWKMARVSPRAHLWISVDKPVPACRIKRLPCGNKKRTLILTAPFGQA